VTADLVRPFLQRGFPWHTPGLAHPDQSPDQWWAALKPVFAAAYAGLGMEANAADDLAGEVRAAYLDAAQWRVFADVVPCLSSLAQAGWTHCILSNHVPELPDLVAALGLSRYFARIVTSARTGYEKPHPEAFRGLLRQLPKVDAAWVVGDSPTADVQGATLAGLPAVLVRNGQDGPGPRCDSLAGLEAILCAWPLSARCGHSP
jgi:putative hydrolase of the HAD superfamily